MNPMMQNLMQSRVSQNLQPIKNMFQTIRNAGNPQMMFQQMISQNPQMQEVMKYVQQNGGDPKTAFYKLANERGINPDEILNQIR